MVIELFLILGVVIVCFAVYANNVLRGLDNASSTASTYNNIPAINGYYISVQNNIADSYIFNQEPELKLLDVDMIYDMDNEHFLTLSYNFTNLTYDIILKDLRNLHISSFYNMIPSYNIMGDKGVELQPIGVDQNHINLSHNKFLRLFEMQNYYMVPVKLNSFDLNENYCYTDFEPVWSKAIPIREIPDEIFKMGVKIYDA